jgi:uncharacterized protein (TIGR00255 family)
MTGYARELFHLPRGSLQLSLRSVNSRFLEVKFHLNSVLFELEKDFRESLKKRLQRGSVDVYLHYYAKPEFTQKVLTQELIEQVAAMREVGITPFVQFESLQKGSLLLVSLAEDEKDEILSCFEKGLEQLIFERQREGKALRASLLTLVSQLRAGILNISQTKEKADNNLKRKLEMRIQKKAGGLEIEPHRLAQELLFYLDRMDVHEEIERLNEHLAQVEKLLDQEEPVGKKLDFYIQEIFRELNTLGSKSSVTQITDLVVSLKTETEKIRELLQNIQ